MLYLLLTLSSIFQLKKTYIGPCQASAMELLVKPVNIQKLLAVFEKDIPKYATENNFCPFLFIWFGPNFVKYFTTAF